MKLNEGQERALEAMKSGRNVFLTGEAGTGKSEVVKMFISMMQDDGKQILITAPTGTAADNLKGETIHRVFGAEIGVQKNNRRLTERKDVLEAADIVIIDEISMCRFDLFEYVARRILFENEERARDRLFRRESEKEIKEQDLQLIVLGDFYQLPPVITHGDELELSNVYKFDYGKGYAFKSKLWDAMNFQTINLTEVIRQDDSAFKCCLSEIRKADKKSIASCIDYLMRNSSSFPMTGDDSIVLVGTNSKCKEINDIEMDKLQGQERMYFATASGDISNGDKFADDVIILKPGCKVMTTINSPDGTYVNGTMGIAKEFLKNSVNVLTENEKLINVGIATKEITKPVVKEKIVKKMVEEPVCDADGVPQTGEDGNVITRHVFKECAEQEIVHEKVGSFSQIPIKVAYAITVHKSQGKTFEKVNFDPYAWDDGQFYTGLSRAKRIENVCFLQPIQTRFVKTSSDVRNFMKRLEKASSGKIEV